MVAIILYEKIRKINLLEFIIKLLSKFGKSKIQYC